MLTQNNVLTQIKKHRLQRPAQHIARTALNIMANRPDTDPDAVKKWLLVDTGSLVILFAVLDDANLPNLAPYLASGKNSLLYHLQTVLHRRVLLSNHSGVRFAIIISVSERASLPQNIAFPGWRKGVLQIGVGKGGKIIDSHWESLGHVLVVGRTQAGKSNFLRALTIQARMEGFNLLLADPDGRTFSQFEDDPQLLASVAKTLETCEGIVDRALTEISLRAGLFDTIPDKPDNLDEYNARTKEKIQRLLVVLDEFNGTVLGTGGARGDFARKATQIAWRGAKFGVHLILAGQDFSKDIVGPVREQMSTRLCFQVSNASTSKIVLGRSGAEKIKYQGRALTNRWGMVQSYFVSKKDLAKRNPQTGMTTEEEALANYLKKESDGHIRLSLLQGFLKIGERQARRLRADWLSRGLAEKRPNRNNGIYLAR